MGKPKSWTVNIDGINYEVKWNGGYIAEVNGEPIKLQRKTFDIFTGLDQGILLGSKECRFVMINGKADIAIDGVYIDNNKPYIPASSIPWWLWIFIIACGIIPFATLGGAIPVILGIVGSSSCLKISTSANIKKPLKFLYCLFITLAAWGIVALSIYMRLEMSK